METNYDHWKEPLVFDNRRDPVRLIKIHLLCCWRCPSCCTHDSNSGKSVLCLHTGLFLSSYQYIYYIIYIIYPIIIKSIHIMYKCLAGA